MRRSCQKAAYDRSDESNSLCVCVQHFVSTRQRRFSLLELEHWPQSAVCSIRGHRKWRAFPVAVFNTSSRRDFLCPFGGGAIGVQAVYHSSGKVAAAFSRASRPTCVTVNIAETRKPIFASRFTGQT